ncbi:MAG: DUF11 domain-containing protein [Deltaproteobacteria bacterium]|nr:DUF11 domain-containing protein [Deltaproteobacteria bacterium]
MKKVLKKTLHTLYIAPIMRLMAAFALFTLALLSPNASYAVIDNTTTATNSLSCAGTRAATNLGCTANDFTVNAVLSAQSGTVPFCIAGDVFSFNVEVSITGGIGDKYDIGFFAGETGNDPAVNDATKTCSVATFPVTGVAPWQTLDPQNDACSDFTGKNPAYTSIALINNVKVVCQGAAGAPTGTLAVPFVASFHSNSGTTCTGPTDVSIAGSSKCAKGVSTVSGTVQVRSGTYIDVTKATNPTPDGSLQDFTLTASVPAPLVVVSLKNGVYSSPITTATQTVTATIKQGETVRFITDALATDQIMTITESATTFWETSAEAITCAGNITSPVAPTFTTNLGTRTITAALSTQKVSGSCTITNKKRSKITMVKNVDGRVNPTDQFSVTATGGGTLTDSVGAAITAPVTITTALAETTKQTTFWSQPGQALTITDSAASGLLTDYYTLYSCTNAFAGSTTVLPAPGVASSFNLTPGPDDDITCTYTNRAKPRGAAKSFNPVSIGTNDTSVMTITLENKNSLAITGAAFTDTYPAGLINTATPSPAISGVGCTGTFTNPDTTSAALTGATIPANTTCSYTINVTSATAGSYTNTLPAGAVTSTDAGTSPTAASATLTVMNHPAATKAFSPASIGVNETSTLTITLTNSNAANITGAAFTDTYPANLVNAATPAGSTTCAGGTVTAVAGGGSVSLSGATIPASGSCTVTVNVTSATAASYTNTLATGGVTTTNAGATLAPASATLIVLNRPTVSKAFSPTSIGVNDTSTITITLTNSNATDITGAAFTDTYPANLVNAATPAGATTCTGGTVTAVAGGGTLQLSGATIPASGSCTVTVNVTSATPGSYLNTIPAGGVTTANAGSNTGAASDTLTVLGRPTVSKAFSPTSIGVNSTSTITITLTNPNAANITGAAFTDTYPAGLVNAAAPAGSTTCAGGSVTAAAGGGSVQLSGATIPASGSCTITVTVTSATAGSYTNTIAAGGVTTTNAGSNAGAASATLTVLNRPDITKAFSPTDLAVNAPSTLTITLTNSNAVNITGATFTDTLPAGVTVASPVSTSNNCGGTFTNGGGGAIAAGDGSVKLTGGTIPPAGCAVTVDITSATAAAYTNTIAVGDLTTTNAGPNTAVATATVKFYDNPTITKSFSPASIGTNDPSLLTVTVANPNPSALTNVAFTDNYPGGGVMQNATGASPTITGAGCTGTLTAVDGGVSFSLSGATVPAAFTCTYTAYVTATTAGAYLNSTGNVTTNQGVTGAAATATLTVLNHPSVTKAFSPTAIGVGGTSTITITLTNSNGVNITGAAFTDTYPANLVNAATPAGSTTCAGGAVTAAAGAGSVALSGATIPAGGSCTVTVSVTSATSGSYTNTIAAGGVTSTNAGANTALASDTLTVLNRPTVTKTFTPASIGVNDTSTMKVTITNSNGVAITGAAFTDTYPANLVNAATPAPTITGVGCTGTFTDPSTTSVQLSGATIPAGSSCDYTVTVTSATAASYTNTIAAGDVTTTNAGANAGAASATLTVLNHPTIAKAFSPASIGVNDTSTITITLTNSNGVAVTGAAFTDTYPANVVNAASPSEATTCAVGTVTAAAGGGSVALSGATIPAGGSCTLTVTVTSATTGSYTNTIAAGNVTTTNAGANTGAASATLTVLNHPSVTKAFSPTAIGVGGTSTITITLTNSNGVDITGAAFTDTYPANLVNAAAPAEATTCAGGTVTATAGAGSVALSGATIPAGGSCTVTVTVTSATSGSYTNTIAAGGVTSTNAGANTALASDTLTVLNRPTVTKTFTPASIGVNDTSTMKVTITNSNGVAITGAAFTDTYPANLVNAATPAPTITGAGCTGTFTDPSTTSVQLSGATIPAGSSCDYTVTVTSATTGSYTNTIAAGGVTTTNAGANAGAASATLTVLNHPTVTKAFAPILIGTGGTSLLTITLANSNVVNVTGAAFTDTYPANLVNAATPAGSTTCTGGTVTAAAGGGSVALSGATIPAGGSCTVTVNVRSSVPGTYTNTIGIGAITTANAGANLASASDSLTVVAAGMLIISKTVTTYSDPINGITGPLTIPGAYMDYLITINNIGAGASSSLVVTDPIPTANVEFFGGNLGGGSPFVYTDTTAPNGLTGITSLEYSNDNGTTWTYAPALTFDPAVTNFRVTFGGTLGAAKAFTLKFRVRVK